MDAWENLHRQIAGSDEMDWGAALTAAVRPYLALAKTVLDLGCGGGKDALRLAREGFHVVGLDLSSAAIGQAEARAKEEGLSAEFLAADMSEGLPFPPNSFDAVLANLSLHYFTSEKTRFVMSEVRRVLAQGGVLVMHVNAVEEGERRKAKGRVVRELEPGFYLEQDGVTRRYLDREDLEQLLEGWRVLKMEKLEIQNPQGKAKHCWRAVARNYAQV